MGIALGFVCSPIAGLILVGYVATNAIDTGWLKRIPLMDVFILAGFYVARILGGASAGRIGVSEWLIAFAGFFFLGLAFLKRATELGRIEAKHSHENGRGYLHAGRDQVEKFGVSSGFMASLVMALYIQSPMASSTYRQPDILWLSVPLLLLWTCRMWLLTGRGKMNDDPIVFAVKDRFNWVALGLLVSFGAGARYLR